MGRFQKPPGLAMPYDMTMTTKPHETVEEFESYGGDEMKAEKV